MTDKVSLNRKQLGQLFELYQKFEEVEWFTIIESQESGIGPSVTVKFDLFNKDNKPDTTVDITDVSTW